MDIAVLLGATIFSYFLANVLPGIQEAGQNMGNLSAVYGLIPLTLIFGGVYGVAKKTGII